MIRKTQNVHVAGIRPLITPAKLIASLRAPDAVRSLVAESREEIKQILCHRDRRLLMVVGPCSIHERRSALDYAERLSALRRSFQDRLCIIMRVYFEKPRTTIGWKGFIADPRLDGSGDIETGLREARSLLLSITGMGLPAATEMLDPIVPQYIADLITWAAIGARTTESQTHREMASGLSMPVGFKNSTDGNLQIAVDAMESARHPHQFLGIDLNGLTAVVKTSGNPNCHIILRGGRSSPNYRPASLTAAERKIRAARLRPSIMVDCSHANSDKQHERQETVLKSVIRQKAQGRSSLIGLMLESHLVAGSQPIRGDPGKMRYGVSVTDACIGWEKTEELLAYAYKEIGKVRSA